MVVQEYNKEYVSLRSKLRNIKNRIITGTPSFNESTLSVLKIVDSISKELDMKYIDEENLEAISSQISILEENLMVS
jgi:hypothetical protein